MNSATRRTVAVFGALAGLAGVEHGVGELLQGNRSPGGLVIQSWPGSALFRILDGEPAMTIVPNLRASGVLAILVSLCLLVWATMFVGRRRGGLVLIALSLVLLLVGGWLVGPTWATAGRLLLICGAAISAVGATLFIVNAWRITARRSNVEFVPPAGH